MQLQLRFSPWPWELLPDAAAREATVAAAGIGAVFEPEGRLGINFSFPVIESIAPGGLASELCPQLEPGLLLAKVAGKDALGLAQAEAFALAAEAGRPLQLHFLRVPWCRPPPAPKPPDPTNERAATATTAVAAAAAAAPLSGGTLAANADGNVKAGGGGAAAGAGVGGRAAPVASDDGGGGLPASFCATDPVGPPGGLLLTINAPPSVKLGLHFHRHSDPPFALAKLSEGGLGHTAAGPAAGLLVPGCVLAAVGAIALDGLGYDEGLAVLKAAPRPVTLRFLAAPTTEI